MESAAAAWLRDFRAHTVARVVAEDGETIEYVDGWRVKPIEAGKAGTMANLKLSGDFDVAVFRGIKPTLPPSPLNEG